MTAKKERTFLMCKKCGKKFTQRFAYRNEKYCSKECWSVRGDYREKSCIGCGKIGLGKWGKYYCSRSCAHKQVGEKAQAFKSSANYSAIHKWIRSHFGKPETCLYCETKGKRMHWANIDHKYSRNRNDWISLCAKCHSWFDKKDPHYCGVILARWEQFTGQTAVLVEEPNHG